ncbi:hypothetical protein EDC04DRAFT_2659092, partial [Pisolithus marmoratus]
MGFVGILYHIFLLCRVLVIEIVTCIQTSTWIHKCLLSHWTGTFLYFACKIYLNVLLLAFSEDCSLSLNRSFLLLYFCFEVTHSGLFICALLAFSSLRAWESSNGERSLM